MNEKLEKSQKTYAVKCEKCSCEKCSCGKCSCGKCSCEKCSCGKCSCGKCSCGKCSCEKCSCEKCSCGTPFFVSLEPAIKLWNWITVNLLHFWKMLSQSCRVLMKVDGTEDEK